jgi:hypothetical protein
MNSVVIVLNFKKNKSDYFKKRKNNKMDISFWKLTLSSVTVAFGFTTIRKWIGDKIPIGWQSGIPWITIQMLIVAALQWIGLMIVYAIFPDSQ